MGRSSLWADESDKDGGSGPPEAGWVPAHPNGSTPGRPQRDDRRRGPVGWFLHRYGWRAYAIPVLVALTVLVVVEVGRPPRTTQAAPATVVSSAVTTVISGVTSTRTVTETPSAAPAPTAGAGPAAPATTPASPAGPIPTGSFTGLSSAALPPGDKFVARGRGTWHVVKGTSLPMGSGPLKYTFTVEVEDGIENAQADQDFASLVDDALSDPRSWIGKGSYTLQRVDSGVPSFRISLTSQLTARSPTLCGWEIHYEASCYARGVHRVAINNARWSRGAVSFNGDRGSYRVYAINHEVGHALGYAHQACATNGGLAPVMMQQSWSTADDDLSPLNPQLIPMDGKVCKFNPYPYPLGQRSSTSAASAPVTTKAGG